MGVGAAVSTVDEMIRIARELDPPTWEKVDALARIIDPGAFTDAVRADGTLLSEGDDLTALRLRSLRANAEGKAWQILQHLGIVPREFDWLPVFARLHPTPTPESAVEPSASPES